MADEEKTKISWQRYLLHNQSNTQALMDVTHNNSFALLFTINICMRLFDSKAKDLFTVAIQSFFPPIAAHKAWPNEETLLRKQYFLGVAKLAETIKTVSLVLQTKRDYPSQEIWYRVGFQNGEGFAEEKDGCFLLF